MSKPSPSVPLDWGEVVDDLINARVLARMTQEDVANMVGVTRPTLSQWESGKHCPTVPSFFKWLAALNIDIILVPAEDRHLWGITQDWRNQ